MGMLRDRLVLADGPARLRGNGETVTEVVGRLEAGDSPVKLVRPNGLTRRRLDRRPGSSRAGRRSTRWGRRSCRPVRPIERSCRHLSEPAWVAVFPSAPHRTRLSLSAGLLQIHDFWDASHDAAQRADDLGEREFSAYWHGIAHRREPDAGNAAYWFRRVGKHPVFKPLAEAGSDFARPGRRCAACRSVDLRGRLERDGHDRALYPGAAWHPRGILARKLQRLEMWLLLEATCAAITG